MKLLVLVFAIEAANLFTHAQGIIGFGNNNLTPVLILHPSSTVRRATAEDNLFIGVFYGPVGSTSADSFTLAPGLATIGLEPGVMINAPANFPLPGAEPFQPVWIQIRSWDAGLGPDGWRAARAAWQASPDAWPCDVGGRFYGQTRVSEFVLAPPDRAFGTPIWDTSPGGDPFRFEPLTLVACPEPSTIGLAALAGAALLLRWRRKRRVRAA